MAENKVSIEDVKKIAQLSNLNLTDQEFEMFAQLFTDTLKYMNELEELDTSMVQETFQVTGLVNVFQGVEDPAQTLETSEALKNAKDHTEELFVTKGVFDR